MKFKVIAGYYTKGRAGPSRLPASVVRYAIILHELWRKVGGFAPSLAPQAVDAAAIGVEWNIHPHALLERLEKLLIHLFNYRLMRFAEDQIGRFQRIVLQVVQLIC